MTTGWSGLFWGWTGGGLALLAGLQLGYRWRERKARKARDRGTSALFRCAGCGHVYPGREDVPLEACPACGKLNESVRGV